MISSFHFSRRLAFQLLHLITSLLQLLDDTARRILEIVDLQLHTHPNAADVRVVVGTIIVGAWNKNTTRRSGRIGVQPRLLPVSLHETLAMLQEKSARDQIGAAGLRLLKLIVRTFSYRSRSCRVATYEWSSFASSSKRLQNSSVHPIVRLRASMDFVRLKKMRD